jgi:AcrR family transcriptional regulator
MEGVTLRDVAQEAGWSIGILQHYFKSKDDLLRYSIADPAWVDGQMASAQAGGQPTLRSLLAQVLPATDAMRGMWRIWMAFWVWRPSDPAWEEERLKRQRRFRRWCTRLVAEAQAAGALPASLDPEAEGDRLAVLIHGLSVEAVLDPGDWPPEKQHAVLDEHLARLRVGGAAAK